MLGLALGLIGWVGCRPEMRRDAVPLPVRTVTVQKVEEGSGLGGTAYLATVRGRHQITLSFKVTGIVELVGPGLGLPDWQEGARVEKGQLLAQLKPTDFLSASNSAAAQAELDRTQYERTSRLLQDGAASQQEYDRALAARRASAAVLEGRRQDLLDSRMLAPWDGTLLERRVNAGETVGAGQPVLVLADLTEVEVEVGVPDRLVGRLRVGDEVPMAFSALGGESFVGRIHEVGVAVRDGGRLFRVLLRVPNREGRLRPGMTASVSLEPRDHVPSGVLVPLSALVARRGRDLSVWVVDGGVVREREVQVGELMRSSVLVKEGLSAGERVVVSGATLLHEGAEVAPVEVSLEVDGWGRP
jgi:RND family efflux transporter MFP subunit